MIRAEFEEVDEVRSVPMRNGNDDKKIIDHSLNEFVACL
ncbi:protein of unknown function [Kyrpidia spormannii]|uniref:Uncharacterized protein n=1 Tax=Kyrpidia spormannii TaxID=2055160 RepID=A0A6F9EGI8_9BACL|nr:protein of unknown function [Kyrpidia spormannii]